MCPIRQLAGLVEIRSVANMFTPDLGARRVADGVRPVQEEMTSNVMPPESRQGFHDFRLSAPPEATADPPEDNDPCPRQQQ